MRFLREETEQWSEFEARLGRYFRGLDRFLG